MVVYSKTAALHTFDSSLHICELNVLRGIDPNALKISSQPSMQLYLQTKYLYDPTTMQLPTLSLP